MQCSYTKPYWFKYSGVTFHGFIPLDALLFPACVVEGTTLVTVCFESAMLTLTCVVDPDSRWQESLDLFLCRYYPKVVQRIVSVVVSVDR